MSDDYWFKSKTIGWGVTPANWQGWVLTAGYLGLLTADLTLLHVRVARLTVAAALTLAFLVVAAHKTEGGLGWPWISSDR